MYTEAGYSIRNLKGTQVLRVLVTGAAGSIGSVVVPQLRERDKTLVVATDVDELDVRNPGQVQDWVLRAKPHVILHLAGAKHAPEGEVSPRETTEINTLGTCNIVAAAGRAKVVLASTCKAADPETVYGASKLIAEREVLNAKGVVVRYYNVRETQGNVFRHWEALPAGAPLPVTDSWRYFITTEQAARLTIAALDFPSGRYTVDPGPAQHMGEVADKTWPGRKVVWVGRRRGDRHREPLHAKCERWEPLPGTGFVRILGEHDPA